MHKLAVLALDTMVLIDLVIPYETFKRATDLKGRPCYRVNLVGSKKNIVCSGVPLKVDSSLSQLRQAETIVIPGMADPDFRLPEEIRKELLRAHSRRARLVSICTGALLLAQTNLLDGKRATTHWLAAKKLKEKHPLIEVDANVLFVEEGTILTSAGAFAGMDLCLHILRKDFGAAVAAQAARAAVTPLERSGGQAQFISHELPQSGASLEPVLNWIRANLQKDISIDDIASRAGMGTRTLNRQFHKQMGISPRRWVSAARIQRARELLETTDHSIEKVSELCGFNSALAFRVQFRKIVRSSPTFYRNSFAGSPKVNSISMLQRS